MIRDNKSDERGEQHGQVGQRTSSPLLSFVAETQQAVKAYRWTTPIAPPAIIERCLAIWRDLKALPDAEWDQIQPHLINEIAVLQLLFESWP